MADVKDSDIQEGQPDSTHLHPRHIIILTCPPPSSHPTAYDKIRSDKDPSTWLLLDYSSPTSNKLVLTKTGEGSIEEFAKELDKEKAQFGYVRVKYQNDEQSSREKFVLVIFIGTDGKRSAALLECCSRSSNSIRL